VILGEKIAKNPKPFRKQKKQYLETIRRKFFTGKQIPKKWQPVFRFKFMGIDVYVDPLMKGDAIVIKQEAQTP